MEYKSSPHRSCEGKKLTAVLTEVFVKPIASLIVEYSLENMYQRTGMRLLKSKQLSDKARDVLHEYNGVSWVAESVITSLPGEMATGVNVNPALRAMLRYNTTEHGCTYGQFYELLIVHPDVHSNSLFLDYRSKKDETSGVIHKYNKLEISIPLEHFQDPSFSEVEGYCACGEYHTL
jgi:hypothetical protein